MYIPASFREARSEILHAFMQAHPLGLLITHGPSGLQASPLPFLLYPDEGECGVLRAHLARANPHWQDLQGLLECLVVFQGPQAYVTPSWYPSKAETHRAVPTWNYTAVHAWGRPEVTEDAAWLLRQLKDLTEQHEQRRPEPWALRDLPDDYLAGQLKAIIGIEIPLQRIEGKFKLSQNRNAADRAGVTRGLRDGQDPHRNEAVADLVEYAGISKQL
ncbi:MULTISPECIES: FMN-binding negative transcriptional regulator [unclassified Uliginosibacterium]|uniref:FMN-binding negative transcriptional regulator n=1 Tax=unclassified Uliginosibacterium TaxID=2621521 RepID=UPI000C7C65A1|nr:MULTISPECIES: FMN-binding negative transcriptional regulator [unclassified Uliginosibacterium]MDO6384887.1 FMN-binding negative transcriptional regulator [Uliginosibacterium sp. 31-12]PLK48583.1 transcriptional regulator [Uliginosibacterium sp. TH139]